MRDASRELEHAVEAEASLAFAWAWRTNVQNWDDPPAQFQLDGPFAAGSWGATLMPGREPLRWQLREVQPWKSFIIDMPLDGAMLSFEWRFDAVTERRTRLTQRLVLSGRNAAAYAAQVEAGFAATLAEGMKRIARAISDAQASSQPTA